MVSSSKVEVTIRVGVLARSFNLQANFDGRVCLVLYNILPDDHIRLTRYVCTSTVVIPSNTCGRSSSSNLVLVLELPLETSTILPSCKEKKKKVSRYDLERRKQKMADTEDKNTKEEEKKVVADSEEGAEATTTTKTTADATVGEKRSSTTENNVDGSDGKKASPTPKKAKIAMPPSVASTLLDVEKYELDPVGPDDKPREEEDDEAIAAKITTPNLILFSLHPLIKESPLQKLCESYGTVKSITVRSAFASRYGHVEFDTVEEARACYKAINGRKLLHKAILVQPGSTNNSASGGGGGSATATTTATAATESKEAS